MALSYLHALDGGTDGTIKDMPLDTLTNYIGGVGTNGVKKGDAVFLHTNGLIRRTINAASAKAVGIVENVEFTGLVDSTGRYAAVNTSFISDVTSTRYANGMAKVRLYQNAVYAIPVKAGQSLTQANVGLAYGISQDAKGDQTLDTANTTNTVFKVIDFSRDGKTAHVVVKENTTI